MPSQLETLSGLERRLTLTISPQDIDTKVQERLRSLARTVRMPGFRPGKVPLKMVARSYGPQVQAEILGDAVDAAFKSAIDEHKLRVAGQPRIQAGAPAAAAALAGPAAATAPGPDAVTAPSAAEAAATGSVGEAPADGDSSASAGEGATGAGAAAATSAAGSAGASASAGVAAGAGAAAGGSAPGAAGTHAGGTIPPGFTATFEVYPEVALKDPAQVKVDRFAADIGDPELERTLDMLRKQRTTYSPIERSAANGDRLTIDFTGRLDGEVFEGGSGNDFAFVLGEGRMLPGFEQALVGAAPNQSLTFPLTFPDDYGNKGVAGKTVSFEATVKKVEAPEVPELDEEFARTMGVADGDVAKFRADVRANLEREVAQRIRARTKSSAMDAIASLADIEVPKALMAQESEVLAERMKADLKARGVDVAKIPVPAEAFKEPAEKRVRLGLIVGEIVRANQLQAKPDQMRRQIEDLAKTYENPGEVIRWYYSDRERLAEVEAIVVEQNVVDWLLGKADVNERKLTFDELMTDNG